MVHGLTGQGVALPDEDAAEVERRFAALGEELAPRDERERIMARRVAFLSVRLERCERYEAATLSKAIRGAEADEEDDRLRAVETWAGRIADRPSAAVRELGKSPEGIDWMIRAWDDLLGTLLVTRDWGFAHVVRAENLQGRHVDELGMSRVSALSSALHGDFRFADPDGPAFTEAGPGREARVEAARTAIAAIIEAEQAKLRRLRADVKADDLARDRAEAPARRLFDPSDAAQRFRRYEGAAAREMYRLFAHFDRRDELANPDPETDCVAVGSVCRTDAVPERPKLAAAPDPARIAASPAPDAPPPGHPSRTVESARPSAVARCVPDGLVRNQERISVLIPAEGIAPIPVHALPCLGGRGFGAADPGFRVASGVGSAETPPTRTRGHRGAKSNHQLLAP